jgi:hypothetical protein
VVFGLKFSSDVLAPIFFAATLAILFTPALWWLEKKGLPAWLALLVMVEELSNSPDTRRATLIVDSADSPVHKE